MKAHKVEQLDLAAVILGVPNDRLTRSCIEKRGIVRGDLLRPMAASVFFILLDYLRRQRTAFPPSFRVDTNSVERFDRGARHHITFFGSTIFLKICIHAAEQQRMSYDERK
jgi:hypothetical protein